MNNRISKYHIKQIQLEFVTVSDTTAKKKKRAGLCLIRFCKNKARSNETKCNTCSNRMYRLRYPVRYAYKTLRDNAKRRGKPFNLTYIEFEQFCKASNYIELKGTNPDSYSIDRIDDSKGYEVGNLQILTVSNNVKKQRHRENEFKGSCLLIEQAANIELSNE